MLFNLLAGVDRGAHRDVTLAALLRFLNGRIGKTNRAQGMPDLADVDLIRRAHSHEVTAAEIDAEISFTADVKRGRAREDKGDRAHTGEEPFAEEINVLGRD